MLVLGWETAREQIVLLVNSWWWGFASRITVVFIEFRLNKVQIVGVIPLDMVILVRIREIT